MLTLTTNLAVWMSAVTDESVHKAHSKLKKNVTEEIFRWLLKGNLPICEAIWSREGAHEAEIVLQVRFYPFSEGLSRPEGSFNRAGMLKACLNIHFLTCITEESERWKALYKWDGNEEEKEKERFNLPPNFFRKKHQKAEVEVSLFSKWSRILLSLVLFFTDPKYTVL